MGKCCESSTGNLEVAKIICQVLYFWLQLVWLKLIEACLLQTYVTVWLMYEASEQGSVLCGSEKLVCGFIVLRWHAINETGMVYFDWCTGSIIRGGKFIPFPLNCPLY